MILLLLAIFGTLLISLFAQWRVKSAFNKYSQVPAQGGHTGAEVAQAMMNRAGIRDVKIIEQPGRMGDHYDPIRKRLVLMSDNFHGTSISAIGVAAHEAGHALQHQQAYVPLHFRMAAVGVTNFASQMVGILPLVGMFLGVVSPTLSLLLMAGGWGTIMLFNLVTLPVEYDASRRAKNSLNDLGFVRNGPESLGVSKVLNAAALTYVAAFITSLIYFLYYVLPLLRGRRQRE